jgi:protein-tyrosine-phosphatase
MFDDSDLVLVMDAANRTGVLRLARTAVDTDKVHYLRSFDPDLAHIDPSGPERHLLEVPDPWQQPRRAFEQVLAMVERSVDGLLDLRA